MEFFSPWHLIIIAIVAVVLFFGWNQLPDMARSLGRSLRVFKTEIKALSEDDKAREDKALKEHGDEVAEPKAITAPTATPVAAPLPRADVVKRPRPNPNGASGSGEPAAPRSSAAGQ